MVRRIEWGLGLFIVALMVFGPIYYRSVHRRQFRNFGVVEEGKIYRSAQLNVAGLQRIKHDYGIRTIVTLREDKPGDDDAEEKFCKANGIEFIRLDRMNFDPNAKDPGPMKNVNAFRKIAKDSSKAPMLVHCYAGKDRTGFLIAAHRIDQGWPLAKVYAEMEAFGKELDKHEDVKDFLKKMADDRDAAKQSARSKH
ncbi:MAG: tyrosine-protein phosphatase [Gemmataceae bacterium]|nr:tyrosine-protein phosphatase [Gemmataceae bacterium]